MKHSVFLKRLGEDVCPEFMTPAESMTGGDLIEIYRPDVINSVTNQYGFTQSAKLSELQKFVLGGQFTQTGLSKKYSSLKDVWASNYPKNTLFTGIYIDKTLHTSDFGTVDGSFSFYFDRDDGASLELKIARQGPGNIAVYYILTPAGTTVPEDAENLWAMNNFEVGIESVLPGYFEFDHATSNPTDVTAMNNIYQYVLRKIKIFAIVQDTVVVDTKYLYDKLEDVNQALIAAGVGVNQHIDTVEWPEIMENRSNVNWLAVVFPQDIRGSMVRIKAYAGGNIYTVQGSLTLTETPQFSQAEKFITYASGYSTGDFYGKSLAGANVLEYIDPVDAPSDRTVVIPVDNKEMGFPVYKVEVSSEDADIRGRMSYHFIET